LRKPKNQSLYLKNNSAHTQPSFTHTQYDKFAGDCRSDSKGYAAFFTGLIVKKSQRVLIQAISQPGQFQPSGFSITAPIRKSRQANPDHFPAAETAAAPALTRLRYQSAYTPVCRHNCGRIKPLINRRVATKNQPVSSGRFRHTAFSN